MSRLEAIDRVEQAVLALGLRDEEGRALEAVQAINALDAATEGRLASIQEAFYSHRMEPVEFVDLMLEEIVSFDLRQVAA